MMPDLLSLIRGNSLMETRAPMELRGSGPISGPIIGGAFRRGAGRAFIPAGMIGFLMVYETVFFGDVFEDVFSFIEGSNSRRTGYPLRVMRLAKAAFKFVCVNLFSTLASYPDFFNPVKRKNGKIIREPTLPLAVDGRVRTVPSFTSFPAKSRKKQRYD